MGQFKCEYCGRMFPRPVTSGHKRKCPEFLISHPDRGVPICLCGHGSTSLTQMKRHRASCEIWKARDKNAVAASRILATFQMKYGDGVRNAIQVPGASEKKAATMKERYGAENPFSRRSSLFDKVQAHWDGKDRTAHLPKDNFARPKIREKIRQTNLNRYGVENPSQSPEIRAKQLATNLERYGDEQPLRVPSVRAKGIKTNLEKLGVRDPMQSPEIVEKVRQTNLERYGVEWTTQHPDTRSAMSTALRRLLSTDAGRKIYSLTHNESLYQVTCLEKYGVTHPMKNLEYARKHLEHSRRSGPNKVELKFSVLYPFFCFSGNGSFWKQIPSTKQNRNPDFCFPVYPKMDGRPSFKSVTHVVEIFGDYWHGESRTGEANSEHEKKTMDAWAEVGLRCLIVWERELVKVIDFIALDQRVSDFLA